MASEFQKRVYSACKQISKGKVSTYGAIARFLGVNSAQAIGQALKVNPYAPKVPCHRVVSSTGAIGGFKGETKGLEIQEKIGLLESEGIIIIDGKIDLAKFGYEFGIVAQNNTL